MNVLLISRALLKPSILPTRWNAHRIVHSRVQSRMQLVAWRLRVNVISALGSLWWFSCAESWSF